MQIKQIVGFGFGAALLLTLASGKGGLQTAQANLDSDNEYSKAQDGNKNSIQNAKRESQVAWQMVEQESCIPVIGLTPRVNEWSFVSVPLAVGQIATIGGKKEQPFAPGSLLCSNDGRIGRVGLGGKVESPIMGSQTPHYLPVVPADKRQQFVETLAALSKIPNTPQAVVSSLQELAQRRLEIQKSQAQQLEPTNQPVQTTQAERVSQLPTQNTSTITAPQPQPQPQKYPTFAEQETVQPLPNVTVN